MLYGGCGVEFKFYRCFVGVWFVWMGMGVVCCYIWRLGGMY